MRGRYNMVVSDRSAIIYSVMRYAMDSAVLYLRYEINVKVQNTFLTEYIINYYAKSVSARLLVCFSVWLDRNHHFGHIIRKLHLYIWYVSQI